MYKKEGSNLIRFEREGRGRVYAVAPSPFRLVGDGNGERHRKSVCQDCRELDSILGFNLFSLDRQRS